MLPPPADRPAPSVAPCFGDALAVDGNTPPNLGAGTDEDPIIVARLADLRSYETPQLLKVVPIVDAAVEKHHVRVTVTRCGGAILGRHRAGVFRRLRYPAQRRAG